MALDGLKRFFGKRHDLPTTPPEPDLTPEEEAVAHEQRDDDVYEQRIDRQERAVDEQ